MIPVTYAGGIASLEDIEHFRKRRVEKDFTIGSALDLFEDIFHMSRLKNISIEFMQLSSQQECERILE